MMRPDRIWEITPFTFVVQTWSSAFTWVAVIAMRQTTNSKHGAVDVLENVVMLDFFFQMMSRRPVLARRHCRTPVAKIVKLVDLTAMSADLQKPEDIRVRCEMSLP